MRWTFVAGRLLSRAEIAELEAIPPVKAWESGKITAPANAAPVVRGWLDRHEIPFSVTFGDDPPSFKIQDVIKDAQRVRLVMRERVAGFDVPFPDYLTGYQTRGLEASLAMPGGSGMLVWAAGSGKTLEAILWIACSPAPAIVVTKAAVKLQWAGEVVKFTTIAPTVLDGATPKEIPRDARIVILSYEILPAWIAEIERWAETVARPSLVFDESQKVQSHKRWDAVVAVTPDDAEKPEPTFEEVTKVKFNLKDNIAAAAFRLSKLAGRRLATTATPIRDRVRNLWAQLDLVHPYEWGGYWAWAKRYTGAVERVFGGLDDTGLANVDELRERLEVVRHQVTKEEANAGLPALRRLVTYVPIAAQVRAEGFAHVLKRAALEGPNALLEARLMEAAARKRRRVIEIVEMAVEGKQKVCVFTGRRADCDKLRQTLGERLIGKALVTGGHGGDSVEEREKNRLLYMGAAAPAVLVGTTDAWGEGLNLHDTDLGLITLLPYTPGQIIQIEGRWHRLGMTRPVLVQYLVAEGTVDERVASILLAKVPALDRLIEQKEIAGFARDMSGADDATIMDSIAKKILGGAT